MRGTTGGPADWPFGASIELIRGFNNVDELAGTEPTADWSDLAWFTGVFMLPIRNAGIKELLDFGVPRLGVVLGDAMSMSILSNLL